MSFYEFCKILVHVPFTTSKMNFYIYCKKPHVQVASVVAEQLKT